MRVTVAASGKFHAFQLARQLARHGALERLLCADPRVHLAPGVPLLRTRSLALAELVQRLPRHVPGLRSLPANRLKLQLFDRWAGHNLGRPDVAIAWSGSALRTLRRARRAGALGVLERGSTHIEHQAEVLRQEFDTFGLREEGVPAWAVEQELREYAEADRIMVPSTYARRTFLARGFAEDRVLQVPYGADVTKFSPGVKADDVFRIAYVGALSLQKGLPYLLEAVDRLRLPNSELVLIGPVLPELVPILQRFEGRFRTVGPQSHGQIADLLRQSSVFAFPSLQEGLSLALREAHASGLPIVATDASGAEDVIQHGVDGFVVPPRDVDALAEGLERLYRDRALRDRMAAEAARRARAWTWDSYGDAIVETYARELARHRATATA